MNKIFKKPFNAITFETGFIMAASAEIFWRVMLFPADISTMAIWDCPVSQTVINLSDSKEHDPNLIFSAGIDKGGVESCTQKKMKGRWNLKIYFELMNGWYFYI